MQFAGYVEIDGKKILLLVRSAPYGKKVKLRQSGKPGHHLTDEETFLREAPQFVGLILDGKVVYL
jgi:hypothetical protein